MKGSVVVEKVLLESYKQIFKNKKNDPSWAVHKRSDGHTNELVHCSIPFVGKKYGEQNTKILMYASAENLTGYCGHLDNDDYAVNRHRNKFEETAGKENFFFPNVHIAPIEDGCLAIVALYVFMKLEKIGEVTPADFFEMISFGNYCKYTKASVKNEDYVSDFEMVEKSHDYIRKDFEVLKPDCVIMPKSIYDKHRGFIDGIKGEAKIIPIYQINAGNINRIIKRKYPLFDEENLNNVVKYWYDNLKDNGINGTTKTNYLAVFSYLDDVLKNNGILD